MAKKLLALVLILAVVGVGYVYTTKSDNANKSVASNSTSTSPSSTSKSDPALSPTGKDGDPASKINQIKDNAASAADAEEDDELVEDDATAAEKYKSAAEALEAVKKGSVDYDDIVLDYFVEPGPDCTWCPEFYEGVKKLINDPSTDADQRGYYGEILAISGKFSNIQTLVEGIKGAPNQDVKDALAESLELAIGDDKTAEYLSGYLNDSDPTLKEAAVAALSNQGSRLAAEALYKNAVETKNPEGFYSLGIGLGELVPDEEALPFLHEAAQKRDEYSHLAVKSLLNSGAPGLSILVDIMNKSNDANSDTMLLRDAEDHIIYDKEVKSILDKVAESNKNPRLQEFAKKVLQDFDEEDLEDDEDA